MQAITFYALLPLIYFFSVLPFWVLYRISDVLFVVFYYLIGYRRKVVETNLRNAFPEKSEAVRAEIARRYYRYLCDLMVETLKMVTIRRKSLLKRCHFADLSLFNQLYQKNKKLLVVMGHFGNWEWSSYTMTLSSPYHLHAIYKPLQNPYFDRFFLKVRSRFGAELVAKNNALRVLVKSRDQLTCTTMIADQTPSGPGNAYWIHFLNQETAVYHGTERLAQKFNYPLVFVSVRRVRRGYYQIITEELFHEPGKTSEGEVTRAHSARLEEEIRRQPETWLWSHRRWKHQRPQEA
jgi:KDO2-lipid IV(A) lauroyltransferase